MKSLGDMVRRSQPSLFWCTRGLPRANREAIYTLSAFCRHIDDSLRSPMNAHEKTDLLNAWKEELDNIYDKKIPATNIGRKIYKTSVRFDLAKGMWLQILQSAYLDAQQPLQAPTQDVFEQYVVGMSVVPLHLTLMITVPEHPRANQELALNLGKATAITYILRDIKSDAKRGHMYLPSDVLKETGVEIGTPQKMLEDKNLIAARAELAKKVSGYYDKAERLLSKMDKSKTKPLRLLMNTAQALFDEMNERGWEVISPKPNLSITKRLNILYKTLFR